MTAQTTERASLAERPRRPLSAVSWIALATCTGAIVFVAGVYVIERCLPVQGPARSAPSLSSSGGTLPVATATSASAVVARSAVVERPESPAPSAAGAPADSSAPPRAPASAPQAAQPEAQAPIRADRGALRLISSEQATVYLNGVAVGPTNRLLDVPCGQFFVRIGVPVARGVRWLSAGATTTIACGSTTEPSAP